MKLEDVKEEPAVPTHSRGGGTVTIMSGGKRIVMNMNDFHEAMDPVTGTLSREFWGEGIEGRPRLASAHMVDSHLGGVRDDC
jgi:hypothetical protein